MALRGTAAGGYSFAIPAGYDDTADLSVFLWIRRSSSVTAGARIFTLVNAGRKRGFTIHLGGTVGGTTSADDVVVSVGSTRDTIWGVSDQGGRGRSILPGLSETEFCPLAFSVRGSAAPDNTGAAGTQQLHQVWWKGAPASVTATTLGSGIPATGGFVTLLCREASNLSAFNGWVAEAAVWQDHRLTEAEAMLLSRGGCPLWVAPEKLLFYRSFRSTLTAEVGNMALTVIGSGMSLEPHVHPALLLTGSRAAHALAGQPPLLTPASVTEKLVSPIGSMLAHTVRAAMLAVSGRLDIAAGRHEVHSGNTALAAAGFLQMHGAQLLMRSATASLLPLASPAAVMPVAPENRVMIAGL